MPSNPVGTRRHRMILRSSEWARGGGPDSASLLDASGKRCCLGVAARCFGVRLGDIENCPIPHFTERSIYQSAWGGNEGQREIATINDSPGLTDEQRLEILRPLFAAEGIEIDWRPNE